MADPLSIVSTLAALSSYAMLNRRQRALKHANDSSIEQEHGGSAKWGLIQVHPPEHRIAQQAGVEYYSTFIYPLRDIALTQSSIIFVHGLLGDPIQTWTAETGGFWPRDYLPCDIKNARVLTFGYSALLGDGLSTSIKGLGQLLLGTICRDREESGALGRPLVFVAHSLGGLIVKAAST
jgi:hypothetical protein